MSASLRLVLLAAMAASCAADLRMASQPRNDWKAKDRNRRVPFVPNHALYMEPSDFNYEGLKRQRNGGGYDNFLRSNIDNQQDRRNFNTEPGRDHLPFRSYESAETDASNTVQEKIPNTVPGPAITATPGKEYIIPLRWNNPHSSELEVNVWVMDNQYVVPIRLPTCSGEGHQDNVFYFTIPTDFNTALAARVPGFTGCKQKGDCVLQIYAHSVESRMYAMGTPLIVTGTVPPATATTPNVEAVRPDVGLNIGSLQLRTCKSSEDADANIVNAVPRTARLVSDQFNHAYQNSDFSPYAGQQPDKISRNMQASCILKMAAGNRGELGKRHLGRTNRAGRNFARQLDRKARKLIRVYEGITNQIIASIGNQMQNIDANIGTRTNTTQKTETCFRCAEVGAVNRRRKTTNTYVPSFQIPQPLVATARLYIAPIYQGLLEDQPDGSSLLLIYEAVLADLNQEFFKLGARHQLGYLGPAIKTTTTTMADAAQFLKKDAAGKNDRGYYAAQQAQSKITNVLISNCSAPGAPAMECVGLSPSTPSGRRRLQSAAASTLKELLALETPDGEEVLVTEEGEDMNGVYFDSSCDNDKTANSVDSAAMEQAGNCTVPGKNLPGPWQLFADVGQLPQEVRSVSASPATNPVQEEEESKTWMYVAIGLMVVAAGLAFATWYGCLNWKSVATWARQKREHLGAASKGSRMSHMPTTCVDRCGGGGGSSASRGSSSAHHHHPAPRGDAIQNPAEETVAVAHEAEQEGWEEEQPLPPLRRDPPALSAPPSLAPPAAVAAATAVGGREPPSLARLPTIRASTPPRSGGAGGQHYTTRA